MHSSNAWPNENRWTEGGSPRERGRALRSCAGRSRWWLPVLIVIGHSVANFAGAEDLAGIVEHPMFERYPGQEIRWQEIENYRTFKIPTGPVVGYRAIGDWIETEGRVTRTFYRYQGTDRTFGEIYKNYLEAMRDQGFEILGSGLSPDRKGNQVGSRTWSEVYFIANPATRPGEVGTLFSGTSSSGGAGAIVATRDRAAGRVYVVVSVEQHSSNYVGTLIDLVEVEAAETGRVVVDAEAIGSGLLEYGRVVLDGVEFEFDSDVLRPESKEALEGIAQYLAEHPEKRFYVVGHTDSVGTFSYNAKLSADRARSVVAALRADHGVARDRLEPHGVGPLTPVFSNREDAGRERNRRVELVERQAE